MMVGVIGAIANDTRDLFIVNVPNHGSLPDLPYHKIVEGARINRRIGDPSFGNG